MTCEQKAKYPTLPKAYKMIDKLKGRGVVDKGVNLRVYYCPKCCKWHLTHKPLKK